MIRILKLILGGPFWLLGVGVGGITVLARVAMEALWSGMDWLGVADLSGPIPACSACGSTAFRVICLQCDDDEAECYDSLADVEQAEIRAEILEAWPEG